MDCPSSSLISLLSPWEQLQGATEKACLQMYLAREGEANGDESLSSNFQLLPGAGSLLLWALKKWVHTVVLGWSFRNLEMKRPRRHLGQMNVQAIIYNKAMWTDLEGSLAQGPVTVDPCWGSSLGSWKGIGILQSRDNSGQNLIYSAYLVLEMSRVIALEG